MYSTLQYAFRDSHGFCLCDEHGKRTMTWCWRSWRWWCSQAIISRTFSIINQSQSRSCFPRVKVVHTPLQRDNRYYERENLLMVIKNNPLWRHLSMGLGYDDSNSNDSGVSIAWLGPCGQHRGRHSAAGAGGRQEAWMRTCWRSCTSCARRGRLTPRLSWSTRHVETKPRSSLLKRLTCEFDGCWGLVLKCFKNKAT
jgi:hypothetical protein